MGMLFFILLGLWPLQAFAGWGDGTGSSWHRHGQWSQGRSHGFYQSEGKGGIFSDAATLLASVLEKTAGRRKSRRDRSSSRSRSPSDSKELQELRLYKEQAEASKKAAQEAERQLQEKMKILPMHFRNPKEGKKEARDPVDNSEISRVGMKAIEWMLDKQVDLTDVSTWQGVEYKLTHLESHSLRDL